MKQEFDVLSFDGGGSKGVMEVIILKDVMNAVTILKQDPKQVLRLIKNYQEDLFESADERHQFAQLLDSVAEPIHPTQVFDMIVGTSTGALIAFGLVGGNKDIKDPKKRLPMSVKEVIEMYSVATPRIFKVSNPWHKFCNWISNKIAQIPLYPYGQEGIGKLLDEYYGSTTLKDFDGACIAGAVARKFDNTAKYNTLELFDTKGQISYKVKDVLTATANAPLFFKNPVKIGQYSYVDGGVGGNCPLAQAIPRMKQLVKFGSPNSVLSIAPPNVRMSDIPQTGQSMYWMKYFPFQFTDGFAVYADTVKHYESTTFQRLFPKSKETELFAMDELDVEKMKSAIEKEKRTDPTYFQDVLAAAVVITSRVIKEGHNEFVSLCKVLIEWSLSKQAPDTALHISRGLIKIFSGSSDKLNYAKSLYFTGCSYFDLEKFAAAKTDLIQSYEMLKDEMFDEEFKIKTLLMLGRSYFQLCNYTKAKEAFEEAIELQNFHKVGQNLDMKKVYLSKCHLALNQYEKALEIASEANDPQELFQFGLCYFVMDDYKKAHEQFMKIPIDQVDNELFQATLKSHVGHCNLSLGELGKALILHKDALEISKRVPEIQFDPNMVKVLIMHGEALRSVANFNEGLLMLERAHLLSLEMLGTGHNSGHSLIAECLTAIGLLLIEISEPEQAKSHLEDALDMQRKIFAECNERHKSMVTTFTGLAKLSLDQKEFEIGLTMIDPALEMITQLLPKSLTHAEVLQVKAEILISMDKDVYLEQAQTILEEAMEMIDSNLGKDTKHLGKPLVLHSLAKVFLAQDKLSEALEYTNNALDKFKQTYGSIRHPNRAYAYETKGIILTELQEFDLAKDAFNHALKILQEVFGEDLEEPVILRIKAHLKAILQ